MDVRKVQRVGSGSLSVSLPKSWTTSNNVKPGSTLHFSPLADGGIALRPHPEMGRPISKPLDHTLHADRATRPGMLAKMLVGCYVMGHERIHVVASDRLSELHQKEIQELTRRTLGLSVIDEDERTHLLHVSVDLKKIRLSKLQKRLSDIITLLYPKALEAAARKMDVDFGEFTDLEREVNQHYWLALRSLFTMQRQLQSNSYFAHQSAMELPGDRIILKGLESSADQINTFIKILELETKNGWKPFDDRIYQRLDAICDRSLNLFNESMEALTERNVEKADLLLYRQPMLLPRVNEFQRWILKHQDTVATTTLAQQYAWSLAWLADLAQTICEISINRSLEHPNRYCHPTSDLPPLL